MQLNRDQLMAAHELGEAILRFVLLFRERREEGLLRGPAGHETEDSPDQLLPVRDAASLLALSRAKVYALMESGELPHVKVGRCRRIRRADLLDLIGTSTVPRR